MKNIILLLTVIAFSLVSCQKDNTDCYKFTTTYVTKAYPATIGYPSTSIYNSEQCDLSKEEADIMANTVVTTRDSAGIMLVDSANTTYTKK